jgi:hypothetical protein
MKRTLKTTAFVLVCFLTGYGVASQFTSPSNDEPSPDPIRIVIVEGGREVHATVEGVDPYLGGTIRLRGVTRDGRYYATVWVLSGRVYVGGEK